MRYFAELISTETNQRVAVTDTTSSIVAAVRDILQSELPEKLQHKCKIVTYSTDGVVISELDLSERGAL